MIPPAESGWWNSDKIFWTCLSVLLASSNSFQIKKTSSRTPATAKGIIDRTWHFVPISAFYTSYIIMKSSRYYCITLFTGFHWSEKCCSWMEFKNGLKAIRTWEVFSLLEWTYRDGLRLFPQWEEILFNVLK